MGLGVLLVSGALTSNDILQKKGAWNTLIWFAALVMMASYLNELGLIPWFGQTMGEAIQEVSWITAFLVLSLVYFYSHYFFASNTAHVSSMYGAFLAVAIAVGTPPMLAALVLVFYSNLFSSMTHYGTGPALVLFGSGYVKMGTWWKLGGLISVVNILILGSVECGGKHWVSGSGLPLKHPGGRSQSGRYNSLLGSKVQTRIRRLRRALSGHPFHRTFLVQLSGALKGRCQPH